jgi:deoxycytidylate deaminase
LRRLEGQRPSFSFSVSSLPSEDLTQLGALEYRFDELGMIKDIANLTGTGQYGRSKGNVAIFEYIDGNGNTQFLKAIANNSGEAGHAERLLVEQAKALGINPSQVKSIYTEIAPCTTCTDNLQDYKDVPIYYSFEYTDKDIATWKKSIEILYETAKKKTNN